jgi:hypothetical protein
VGVQEQYAKEYILIFKNRMLRKTEYGVLQFVLFTNLIRMTKQRMRWMAHIQHTKDRNAKRIVAGKSEGKELLIKPRCRWDHNIKIYLREIGWAPMNVVMNFGVQQKASQGRSCSMVRVS